MDTVQHHVINLIGPGWRAELAIEPPALPVRRRTVEFDVPTPSGRRTLIQTDVFYTRATNRLAKAWQSWHVKVYRCATPGDADTLRQYLRRQAIDIQAANADLEGPARNPVEPPWAVVPVQVVRGDGHHDSLDGSVLTELAAPPAELIHRVGQALPAWFEEQVPSPELYVLAVSPHVEQIRWSPFLARPATEQLADFAGMAAGLDALHRLGMAHCDIKPDNTCRYHTEQSAGFVLIDTDAATRLSPPPVSLRLTKTYMYRAVAAGRYDAAALRAHDRFGFALVVLAALAGLDWVQQGLLRFPDDDVRRPRPADDRDAVAQALRRHWPDTGGYSWQPLIEIASEPFGGDIEHDDWSALTWVARLMDAERRCVPGRRPGPRRALPRADPGRFSAEITRIRAEAMAGPASLPERVQHGYAAVERRANAIALRTAAVTAGAWAAGVVAAIGLVLMLFAIGSGG